MTATESNQQARNTLFNDTDRRSGRTTRLLGRAVERARDGERVQFVVYNRVMWREAFRLLQKHYSYSDMPGGLGRGDRMRACDKSGCCTVEIVSASDFDFVREMEHAVFDHDVIVHLDIGVPPFTGGGDKADVDAHRDRYLNDGGRSARINEEQIRHNRAQLDALEKHRNLVAECVLELMRERQVIFPSPQSLLLSEAVPNILPETREQWKPCTCEAGGLGPCDECKRKRGGTLTREKLAAAAAKRVGSVTVIVGTSKASVRAADDWFFKELPIRETVPYHNFLVTNVIPRNIPRNIPLEEAHDVVQRAIRARPTCHEGCEYVDLALTEKHGGTKAMLLNGWEEDEHRAQFVKRCKKCQDTPKYHWAMALDVHRVWQWMLERERGGQRGPFEIVKLEPLTKE